MKPGDKSQLSSHFKRRLAHINQQVSNFLDSEAENAFLTTPVFEPNKPYNVKNESGKPTSTFIGNLQLKLVHVFLEKIGQLQGQTYLDKNEKTCYQGFDRLTTDVIISPNDLMSRTLGDEATTIAEKLGKDKKLSLSQAKLIEWESGINIFLPHSLPTLFFMKLVALTHNLAKDVYQYLSALPLVNLINPSHDIKYLAELYQVSFFIKHVRENSEDYGFVSLEDCDKILNQTLLQLASGPCKYIPGCFFLDNNNQFDEQLTEIGMLYHAGIDFRVKDEFNSYFKFEHSNGKPCITWKDNDCKNNLKIRIKQLFHTLFTAAAINHVQVISLLAVGQGELLKFEIAGQALIDKMDRKDAWSFGGALHNRSQIDKLKDEIRELYTQSLFELLSTNDYQFREFFYNPAQSASITNQVFENFDWIFKCNVTIHNKDCLLLAKNYKKHNPAVLVAFNSPSDPRGVMGNGFWFGRKFETQSVEGSINYLAEEHIISNSTFILGSSLITNADVDAKKIYRVDSFLFNPHTNQNTDSSSVNNTTGNIPLDIIEQRDQYGLVNSIPLEENPFIVLHNRFFVSQFLEGNREDQYADFIALMKKLIKSPSLECYQTIKDHGFTLHDDLSGNKYFTARQKLIDLADSTWQGKFIAKKSFWNFNTSHVESQSFDVECKPSQIEIDKKIIYLAALVDQYRGILWCLSRNPNLPAKEKTFLTDIGFSFVEQISGLNILNRFFN